MKIDLERLGRELLDQLRTRQAEIEAEHRANAEIVAVLEKRLALETSTPVPGRGQRRMDWSSRPQHHSRKALGRYRLISPKCSLI